MLIVSHGSSDLKISQVQTQSGKISLSGSTDVYLAGTVDNAEISLSGSSDFHGFDYKMKNVAASLSGSSEAHIFVSDQLDIIMSGSSDAVIRGEPKTRKVRQYKSSHLIFNQYK